MGQHPCKRTAVLARAGPAPMENCRCCFGPNYEFPEGFDGKTSALVSYGMAVDCKVTLDFSYEFGKRYQWQVDKGKSVTLLGLTITDVQMGELSEAGLAKEFDITGEKLETVNATDANATGPS